MALRRSAAAISAHRGGGETAPEGTYEGFRAALETGAEYIEFDISRAPDVELDVLGTRFEGFRAALETGAEYIEFDIRRTADAQLVVYHDPAIGNGRMLATMGYATLCEL